MTIEGSGLTGEQKTKIENFLLDHLSQYYAKSFVLYSAKHGHQKSIVNGKVDLDTQDELGRLVANLKKATRTLPSCCVWLAPMQDFPPTAVTI